MSPTDSSSDIPVDLAKLAKWMDQQHIGTGSIGRAHLLGGGTQNILIRFCRNEREFVLRMPPLHKRTNSDETMRKEARVLGALAGSAVPHPGLIAAEPSTDVLGSAFYLMKPVEGFNVRLEFPDRLRDDPSWQRALGLAMVDAISALAAVDPRGVGLADLGRPDGWMERQVATWRRQLASYDELDGYAGPPLPHLERITDWLDVNRPGDSRPGLLHGDFHFSNVIVDHHEPVIAAVVDWELATQGDPLLDLGHLLATWPEATPSSDPLGGVGLPETDEVIERYCKRTGRDPASVAWFRVLACFRLGIILEGTFARACAGKAPLEVGDRMRRYSRDLFSLANDQLT